MIRMIRKIILFNLLILILISGIATLTEAIYKYDFLSNYESSDKDFSEFEISDKVIYSHSRKIDDAFVQRDYIVYQFDKNTGEFLKKIVHWRDDLPEHLPPNLISREQAQSMVEGKIQFTKLYYISPESDVFPIKPTPKNPCWIVESIESDIVTVTVIDAVKGTIIGYGIPPPYTAFSLTGPTASNPCSGGWDSWYENARDWFNTMGYNTEAVKWPTEAKVQSHIQSNETAMFYELAHGGSTSFASGCVNGTNYEYTYASEIETWISDDYTKMPFSFIGSCDGMCSTGDNTFSYEFRKGSTVNTTTVGYCNMSGDDCETYCWYAGYTIPWQTALFNYTNQSYTVKDAFDQANLDYPGCANYSCMRFTGDENFKIKPVVARGTTRGGGFCSSSPCVIPSLSIRSRDSIIGMQEPNYPNTIDSCTDGTYGSYMNDESIENITITDLNGSVFRAGDTIQVDITVYCWSDGASDNLNYVYTNDTENPVWKVMDYYNSCSGGGFQNLSKTFVLDNKVGNHTIRGVFQYNGNTADTCGSGNYDDNDDVTILVQSALVQDIHKFYIKNPSGNNVAWFGDLGNIVLKGTCTASADCNAPPDSFIFNGAGYDTVAYIDSSGNLCIEDSNCDDNDNSCEATRTPDSFIFKSGEDVVSWINKTGGLCLEGSLTESGSP